AENDGLHDGEQVLDEPPLARILDRNEAQGPPRHGVAVAEEEIEDEEHEEQTDDGADGPEQDLASAGDRELQGALRGVHEPLLKLRRGERRLLVDPLDDPAKRRDLEQILRALDLSAGGETGD